MANQQVIVSVLGDTKNFSRSMKNSSAIMKGFQLAVVASVVAMGRAFTDFIGDSVSAAEDAVAVQRRFEQMAKQSRLFGAETQKVTDRIVGYARAQSFATGIDDEAILAASSKVLAFRNVAKSADEVNGVFDRTVAVSMDVAAVLGGTGDGLANIESVAPRVAKALENPVKFMSSLARIGIKVTDVEKEKVKRLQETNGLYAAQDYLLGQLESRYGGAALAGAKATDIIKARFEDLQEQVGEALLPSVERIADEFGAWLDGPAGKKAVSDFVGEFERFSAWLTSPDGKKAIQDFIGQLEKTGSAVTNIVSGVNDMIIGFQNFQKWAEKNRWLFGFAAQVNTVDPNKFGTYLDKNYPNVPKPSGIAPAPAPIINFNTPIDSVSAGREVSRVLNAYDRSRGKIG